MNLSPRTDFLEYTASGVGALAAEVFQRPEASRVIGNTSRGVFLLAGAARVIFLSYEPYRGPFTVNLPGNGRIFSALQTGTPVELARDGIHVYPLRISIRLPRTGAWFPDPPALPRLPAQSIRENLAEITVGTEFQAGLVPVLNRLCGLKNATPPVREIRPMLQTIDEMLATGNEPASLSGRLAELLGAGRGLTPSGDDFICGFFLACRRWLPGLPLDTFAPAVIHEAYRKTTTLSANLIEAAAGGQADERILSVCDAVFSGRPDATAAAILALSYGSSSGVDALAGMAAAFHMAA
jgi:hypothetical protein